MADDLNRLFGTAVAARRAQLKLSKAELGRRMGIRGDMLGRMEAGERGWRIVNMVGAARALGTTVGALLGESQHPDPFDATLLAVLRTSGERAAIVLLLDRMAGKAAHT